MTALFAPFAGTLVYIIHLGRGAAVAVLLILTAALIIRNYLKHRQETVAPLPVKKALRRPPQDRNELLRKARQRC